MAHFLGVLNANVLTMYKCYVRQSAGSELTKNKQTNKQKQNNNNNNNKNQIAGIVSRALKIKVVSSQFVTATCDSMAQPSGGTTTTTTTTTTATKITLFIHG